METMDLIILHTVSQPASERACARSDFNRKVSPKTDQTILSDHSAADPQIPLRP